MRFLRSILSGAFFLAFGVGGLVFSAFLMMPVPKAFARRVQRVLFRLFVWLAKATRLFVVDVTPEDLERFRSFRGSVIVANHISLIDVVILISLLGDTVCITKKAVGRNPFMLMIARKILVVNDGVPEDVMRHAGRYLNEGVNVLVFPEGTRVPADASTHSFHRGAAHIAIAANAPVETVFISCDPPVLGKHQHWWDVGGRMVRYSLSYKGRMAAGEQPPHGAYAALRRAAQNLTCRLQERVFAA